MSIYLQGNPQSREKKSKSKASATVVTAATIAAYDTTTGLVIPATSSTAVRSVAGIFSDSIAASVATSADIELIIKDAEYIVSSTNNSDITNNGQRMVLSSAGVVNNTGTDNANGIVIQVGVAGQASDKLIIVRFV